MKIITGRVKQPRRVLLYGPHGIGKTTWASQAPKPLILATEDGCNDIGVDRTPVLVNYEQVCEYLSYIISGEHDYRSLTIDSLDWLERLVHRHTARQSKKSSIEEIAYGKGYMLALEYWDFILNSLDEIRSRRGMSIILISHARIVKYSDPMADSYDRYEPDLHKSICGRFMEWCDEVLFASYKINTIKRDEGFNRTRTRAVGDGARVVYTCETPTYLAKRRCAMPDELPLDFSEYLACLKAANGSANISGIVTDGSSKQKEVDNGKSE